MFLKSEFRNFRNVLARAARKGFNSFFIFRLNLFNLLLNRKNPISVSEEKFLKSENRTFRNFFQKYFQKKILCQPLFNPRQSI
jgi:hypothetical protein